MPWDEPVAEDPLELVGVALPADESSVREMAWTFAEEYAAMGFTEDRLLRLFRSPRYAGAHRAWQLLGEEEIARIVAESVAFFGGVRFVVREGRRDRTAEEHRRPLLPVLNGRVGAKES